MPRTFRRFEFLLIAAAMLATAGCASVRDLDTGTAEGANAARLFVPYQFQVAALDGETIRDSFYTFDARDQRLSVAPGRHTLVLRYFDLIDDEADRSDDYARVLSEPITVTFDARPGGDYAVVGAQPDTPAAGQAFAADPTLEIQSRESGEAVSDSISVAEPEAETIRRGNTVYAPVADAGAHAPNVNVNEPAAAPAAGSPQAYEMLKYWWNNAGSAERARFEAWRETAD